jgi:hypothetical protein
LHFILKVWWQEYSMGMISLDGCQETQ